MGRWLVRQAGQYYVSEKYLSNSSLLSFDTDTNDGLWARYDPTLDLDFKAENALFEQQNFTNIDAVGFVIDQDNYSTSQIWLRMTQFTAKLSVNQVPDATPKASFTATPALGTHPLSATLDGTASADPGGAVTFYAWNIGEGSNNSGPVVPAIYPAAGSYLPKLTVYDSQLQRSQTQRRVEVVSDIGGSPTSTVAAFGGNIGSVPFRSSTLTSGVDIDADGAADDFIQEIPFDPALALSGAATKGTLWHGGLRSTDRNAKASWSDVGTVNTTASALAIRMQTSSTAPITLHGLVYVDKSQFLNRASILPVSFDASSTVKLVGVSRLEQLGQVRWLVRDGQQFYVSSALITPVSQAATLSFSSASNDGDWAAWTPGTSMNFDASLASFSQRNFTDITGIGLVIDRDNAVAGVTRHWLQFTKMEVVAAIANDSTPPLAQMQVSPLNRDAFQRITFDGTGSTSSGLIQSYEWDFGDGTSSIGAIVQHEYLSTGSKTVTLRITNDLGQTDTETFIYQVVANPAPVASFIATPTAGDAPLAVQLDASASTDDASIVSYEWDFQSDGVYDATGVTTTANISSTGLYAVLLRVTDAGGKTATTSVNIRSTQAGKIPPVAVMTPSVTSGTAPLTISFTALPSWDPDGSITAYNWDFTGDNVTDATGLTASWNYVVAGNFTAKLTLIDNDGASASSTQYVNVSVTPGAIPILYWSGNSVSSSRQFRSISPTSTALDLDLDGSTDDLRVEYPFSTSQVLSPTSGYTGSPFYGAVRSDVLNATSFAPSDSGVLNSGVLDLLSQRLQPAATSSARWHWTLFFDKTHFINGGATQPVRFVSNSRLRLANINNNERTGQLRWLVREGSQFYVSQSVMSVASNSSSLTFATDHQDSAWAEYNPSTELNFDANVANFLPRDFTDITAAGFILDKDNYESARHWFNAGTYEFLGALPPSYAEWIASYNVSNSAPTADPDQDGLSNLLEYALGRIPNTVENTAATELEKTSGDYIFRFQRSKLAHNVSYQIQTSTDLQNWQPYTGTELPPVDSGSYMQHQAPISTNTTGRVFVRLLVTE
jgi:PKD repeat protein